MNEELKEIIREMKAQIKAHIDQNIDMDSCWTDYDEGVVISANDAQAIINYIEVMRKLKDSG